MVYRRQLFDLCRTDGLRRSYRSDTSIGKYQDLDLSVAQRKLIVVHKFESVFWEGSGDTEHRHTRRLEQNTHISHVGLFIYVCGSPRLHNVAEKLPSFQDSISTQRNIVNMTPSVCLRHIGIRLKELEWVIALWYTFSSRSSSDCAEA